MVVTSFDRGKRLGAGFRGSVDKLDFILMMMDEIREACEVCFGLSKQPSNPFEPGFSDAGIAPSSEFLVNDFISAQSRKNSRTGLLFQAIRHTRVYLNTCFVTEQRHHVSVGQLTV